MSFVRKKQIPPRSGNWYDYEVQTVHVNGKVIQEHIQYLGKHGGTLKPLLGSSKPRINLAGGTTTPNTSAQPAQPKVVCKSCGGQHEIIRSRKVG